MTAAPRLRIIFFGSSIVSDWRNPLATSARPILAALVGMGHDVLFLEERRNQWLMGIVKTRGLGPERAFSAAYPTIHHRTYDLPRPGNARRVWFAQQVGTADAIIGLPGTPQAVIDEISAFNSKPSSAASIQPRAKPTGTFGSASLARTVLRPNSRPPSLCTVNRALASAQTSPSLLTTGISASKRAARSPTSIPF